MSIQKLKWAAILSFLVAMVILLAGGFAAREHLSPYPGKVVGPDGTVLFQKSDIFAAQEVYQIVPPPNSLGVGFWHDAGDPFHSEPISVKMRTILLPPGTHFQPLLGGRV